jgi:hypothetical protein
MDGEPVIFATVHLGLALFSLSVLALASLSVSQFAPNAPGRQTRIGKAAKTPRDIWSARLRLQLALTLVLGAAAIWIISTARHDRNDANWAYGTLLTLLGYWLRF